MKNAALAAILAIFFILTACTAVEAVDAIAGLTAETPLITGASGIGSPDAIMHAEGNFSYTVIYPVCGVEALDSVVSAWARQIVADAAGFKSMSEDSSLGGQLLVNYRAYEHDGRYISVVQAGVYTGVGSEPDKDILKSFVYDRQESRVVQPVELFPYTVRPLVLEILQKRISETGLSADSSWLENAALTSGGVIIPLPAEVGRVLGEDSVTLDYDSLEGLLLPVEEEPLTVSQPDTEPPAEPEEEDDGVPTQGTELDPDKPIIALTFDDGPGEITAQILEILKRHNVPATFFMIGRQVEEYADTVKLMAEQGCELASHTWDHPNLSTRTDEAIRTQIEDTADIIEQVSGVRPVLLRPPYGEANANVRRLMAEMGVYLVNWSVDTRDWQSRDAQAVYQHILSNVKNGYIILCHDLYQSTCDAIEMAVPALLEQGYQFVTVSRLLGMEEGKMTPGVIYRHN